MPAARRFPPPWSADEQAACFVVLLEQDKTAGPMSDTKSELQLIGTPMSAGWSKGNEILRS
jgi:hypothetical protein